MGRAKWFFQIFKLFYYTSTHWEEPQTKNSLSTRNLIHKSNIYYNIVRNPIAVRFYIYDSHDPYRLGRYLHHSAYVYTCRGLKIQNIWYIIYYYSVYNIYLVTQSRVVSAQNWGRRNIPKINCVHIIRLLLCN